MFTAVALKTLPAMTVATLRTIVAALTLCILAVIFRAPKQYKSNPLQKNIWTKYIIISIFDAVIPFYLMNLGQQHVNSSIASIILSTGSIFVLLLSGIFLPGKHWSFSIIASVLIGFCGIVVLVLPNIHSGSSSTIGELSLLGASLSFAIAIILLKTLPSDNQLKSIRNILVSAAVIMIIPACILDKPWVLSYNMQSLLSIVFLGIVCSGISYLIYIKLIHLISPTFASLCGYLIPIVGVLLGVTYGNEVVTPNELVALAMVFASLLLSQIPQSVYKKLYRSS